MGEVAALDRVTVHRGARPVLDAVTLAVASGDLLAVRGVNGAGKTTLLRTLAGIVRPSAGVRRGPPQAVFIPSGIGAPLLSPRRWLSGLAPRADWRAALDVLGFDGRLDRPCDELSMGNVRKVVLAFGFSAECSLVLLDEASIGLDDRGRAGLATLATAACRRGAGVVQSEQDAHQVAGATATLRVGGGRVHLEPVATPTAVAESLVAITFRGPAERVHTLSESAASLGFQVMP